MRLPRSVRDADVAGKTVLVRADLNVPLKDGKVADDTRIRASLPTLQLLLDKGAAEIRVCSHLGRPKTEEDRPKFTMKPVEERLHELLPDPRIRVLENTRFNPGETKNDVGYARELADGCDVYVDDAFGSAHRAHSSTEAVARLLPAYAGLLLEEELAHLGKLLGAIERPFVLISGGAKVDDKLGVLQHLGGQADAVLVGGKMAEQIREDNPLDFAVELPTDVVGAAEFAEDAEHGVYPFDGLPDGWLGLDIGPDTRTHFAAIDRRREDDLLERADGRVRVGAVRRGHEGGRPGGRRQRAGLLGRRRRRLRARAERARAGRPDLVGLDRRRREPRAARGQGAARRGSDPVVDPADRRRQLEDVRRARTRASSRTASAAISGVEKIVCPPFTELAACVAAGLTTYAQNVHWEPEGAYTGEISAPMLLGLGVAGSLAGHSERRQYFGETDEGVARRDCGGARRRPPRDRLRRRDAGASATPGTPRSSFASRWTRSAPPAARTSGSCSRTSPSGRSAPA